MKPLYSQALLQDYREKEVIVCVPWREKVRMECCATWWLLHTLQTSHLVKLNALLQELNGHVVLARLDVNVSQEKPALLNFICILNNKFFNIIYVCIYSFSLANWVWVFLPVGSTVFWRSSSGGSWPLEFGAGSCEPLPYPATQEHYHAV